MFSERERAWIIGGFILLILAGIAVCAALVYDLRKERALASPTGEVKTFESYLERMASPESLRIIQIDDQGYLMAYGPVTSWIPKGPPLYVFSSHGDLLDWTVDSFDDPDFVGQWLVSEMHEISLDEAKIWITRE